jgi:hypothetical protein
MICVQQQRAIVLFCFQQAADVFLCQSTTHPPMGIRPPSGVNTQAHSALPSRPQSSSYSQLGDDSFRSPFAVVFLFSLLICSFNTLNRRRRRPSRSQQGIHTCRPQQQARPNHYNPVIFNSHAYSPTFFTIATTATTTSRRILKCSWWLLCSCIDAV